VTTIKKIPKAASRLFNQKKKKKKEKEIGPKGIELLIPLSLFYFFK